MNREKIQIHVTPRKGINRAELRLPDLGKALGVGKVLLRRGKVQLEPSGGTRQFLFIQEVVDDDEAFVLETDDVFL